MFSRKLYFRGHLCAANSAATLFAVLVLAFGLGAQSQQPSQPPTPPSADSHAAQPGTSAPEAVRPISEDELRQRFAGKTLYLRSGYLDNDLHFDERGHLSGTSPQASYTLNIAEIDKVHLAKHKVELVGIRYGLHFLGSGPRDEDPLGASVKVRITPKKKFLKITIDRAQVVTPKKSHSRKAQEAGGAAAPKPGSPQPPAVAMTALDSSQPLEKSGATAQAAQPGDESAVLTQARANRLLNEALDRIFAPGLDDRIVASLPDFWQLYYQDAAAKSDYKPADPSILRQNAVDQKARLLSSFEPPSNDFAQAAGVAGMALYHVVVGADGKPGEIAVGRPIGFGLDENAVASIRKASFQPALKDGKPVPVLLDVIVQFRIYSKRTAVSSGSEQAGAASTQADANPLPGPYTANQPLAPPRQ